MSRLEVACRRFALLSGVRQEPGNYTTCILPKGTPGQKRAVLLKPDVAGVYIAQMAPTQAYIVHNGVLSAIPEPQSWRPRPGKVSVRLRKVPNPSEAGDSDADDGGEEGLELGAEATPALPL